MDFKSQVVEILQKHGYTLGDNIGHGAFGECYRIQSTQFPDQKLVCKISKSFSDPVKNGKVETSFRNEVTAMSRLLHPDIVNFYDFFQEGQQMFLVMEDCSGGNCYNLLNNNPKYMEKNLFKFSLELVSAIAFCQSQNVAHLDIKPSNCFIDAYGRLKLGDFGLAQVFQNQTNKCQIDGPAEEEDAQDSKVMMKCKGSFSYMAPELFKKIPVDPFKVDIWALGVTIYHMATGNVPWYGLDASTALREMEYGIRSIPSNVPDILKKVIKLCTQPDPQARPTASALLNLMNTSPCTPCVDAYQHPKTNPLFKDIKNATKSHGSLNLIARPRQKITKPRALRSSIKTLFD